MEAYDDDVIDVNVKDIRFPTSLQSDGSDAMHADPDYSCAYVILTTSKGLKGFGLTFTIGRGTEIVVEAVKALAPMVLQRKLRNIYENFGMFWREITSDSQMRWIGPEKGVIHLATAAIINALWDLWARIERKPLWKLLVDMEPEKLVSTIDFRYITDALSPEEVIEMLKRAKDEKFIREIEIQRTGYPAYCTSVGWIGYSEEKIKKLCKEKMSEGFTRFKAKVGQSIESDRRRLEIIRKEIGYENMLMVDANQRWGVNEAIEWMKNLAGFQLLWIEEPTSPDDVLGHKVISESLSHLQIGVATGEQCQNRVIFKQLLQANAIQYCQIDSCRLGGVNEVLAVYLMAAKFGVPVCPHAGGVGLCEYVQHLSVWDYISLTGSLKDRMIEYVEHLHEHFKYPISVENGHYKVPTDIGYSAEMKEESIEKHVYPHGEVWKFVMEESY